MPLEAREELLRFQQPAMQPLPAAVTAWRKILSCTSPAATPGTLVTVLFGAVIT